VHDLKTVLFGVGLGSEDRVAGELSVGGEQRYRLWLRRLRDRERKEALGERSIGVRTRGDHGEVARVAQRAVYAEPHQADEEAMPLDDERHRGQNGVRTVATEDQVDPVLVEQVLVQARNQGRVAAIVVADEFHGAAEQPTPPVNVFLPDLLRQPRRPTVAGERPG
jgi:hypothetical protein